MIEVTGSIGLLDEKLLPLGEPEPCRFKWGIGAGTWSVEVLSQHELSPASGAFLIAIYDNQDRAMFALPIVGRPIGIANALRIDPAS
jgi:hypothetical protein